MSLADLGCLLPPLMPQITALHLKELDKISLTISGNEGEGLTFEALEGQQPPQIRL